MPKFYILFIIIATLSVSVPARTSKPNHSVKSKNASIEKVVIKLVDHDEKRIEKFESLALLQLHSVLMNSYLELTRQKTTIDWNSAQALFLQMGSEIRKFYLVKSENQKLTPKPINADLFSYFDASETNLKRRAALCEEIGRQKINPYLNEYLFSRIAKIINVGRIPIRPEDNQIFTLYMGKVAQLDKEMEAQVAYLSKIQREYNFSFQSLTSPNFPFRLPLQEYPSESDYLYETFIRNSGLPSYLELYYKNGAEQIASYLLHEVGFNLSEIGLLWGRLFVNRKDLLPNAKIVLGQDKVNLISAGNYLMDIGLDCIESETEKRRKEFYEEGVDLRKAILMKLRTNRQKLTILKQFITETEKSLTLLRLSNERAAVINGLKNKLEDYLKERDKLELFAQRGLNAAENLFLKYLDGDQNLIQWPKGSDVINEKLITLLVRINRTKYAKVTMDELKDAINTNSCDIFNELQNYYNNLAADTLRTKSEAGSQYISEQGARIENSRKGGASSTNPPPSPKGSTPSRGASSTNPPPSPRGSTPSPQRNLLEGTWKLISMKRVTADNKTFEARPGEVIAIFTPTHYILFGMSLGKKEFQGAVVARLAVNGNRFTVISEYTSELKKLGETEERQYRIEGDKLYETSYDPSTQNNKGRLEMVWQRVK